MSKKISMEMRIKKDSLAVSMAILEEYYKVSFKDAYESLVDNGGDCKIDAFFIIRKGIFQNWY